MEQGVLYLLGQSVRKEQCSSDCATELASKAFVLLVQDAAAEMVVMCCRFLCYFCRTSRQNQRAMFEHLSYMLENSSMLLGKLSGVGQCVDDFLRSVVKTFKLGSATDSPCLIFPIVYSDNAFVIQVILQNNVQSKPACLTSCGAAGR